MRGIRDRGIGIATSRDDFITTDEVLIGSIFIQRDVWHGAHPDHFDNEEGVCWLFYPP